jgi:hypothetical protein
MTIKFVPPTKEELAARGIGVKQPAPQPVAQKPAKPQTKE